MRIFIKLIRIYTPFICIVMALLNGVLFMVNGLRISMSIGRGVNIGKANETTYFEQALSEVQSAWNRLQVAGFTVTMPDPMRNSIRTQMKKSNLCWQSHDW